jgi:hypothetical protein
MTLAREAVAAKETGEVKTITAVISAHRKLGDALSELQLYVMAQRRKADKRVSAGGKTAEGESAACLLLHNYCSMVRSAHWQQESKFAKEAAEMLPTSRAAAIAAAKAAKLEAARVAREAAGALVVVAAAEKAERKGYRGGGAEGGRAEKNKKEKAKKYYAVAVGRSHGVFTDWDEVEGYVNGFSGCIFKALKSRHEAKSWYTKKRRLHRRRGRRRGSSGDDTSSDESRGSRSRTPRRRRYRRSTGAGLAPPAQEEAVVVAAAEAAVAAAAATTTPTRTPSPTRARQTPKRGDPTGTPRRAPQGLEESPPLRRSLAQPFT